MIIRTLIALALCIAFIACGKWLEQSTDLSAAGFALYGGVFATLNILIWKWKA